MTDPRPRPKYGEYAPLPLTDPEEVADSVDGSVADSSVADSSGAVPPVVSQRPATSPPGPPAPLKADAAQPAFANTARDALAPERKRRMWDVLLTSTLLLFGVVDVINTFSTVGNLGPVLREGLVAQGVDGFSSDTVAAEAGGAANIVRLVVLVLTIVFALMQIQRKKLAFWIPIVGAAIAAIALIVAIFVAVMGDPAFIAYVEGLQQQQ
jgi:hypothetical protein